METLALLIFIGITFAGLIAALSGGFVFLLWKKSALIIELLHSRCCEEGVAFIIQPGPGFKRNAGKKKKGVVCLTEFELIFIPLLGNSAVQIPMTDIGDYRESETDQFHIIITTNDPNLTFSVRAPQTWVEKAKQQPA
ncbi:hypothetical protein ACFL4W_05355 [Planctomycetota bacterium]